MEVRAGYKQTEIGLIPEDWDCTPIADVARLESGHTPSKREPSYWGGSVQWVSLHDTKALDGNEIHRTSKSITDAGLNNSSARLLPAGTVVFSRTATVGKTTILATTMATSQDFANYICGPDLHNRYLLYLFRSMAGTWRSLMAGSIHNTIYMPVFKALKIPLPSLHEQKAIAAALSDMDALLGGLERLVAKKRNLKYATMQQLLTGQTRLPGFSGQWDQVSLGELFVFKNGLNKAKQFFGYGTPIVNYMDVFGNPTIHSYKLEGRVSLHKHELKNFDVQKGDVFFTRTSETTEEIGIASVILDEPIETVFSGFLLRARPSNERLNNQFKAYCFSSAFVRKQITSKASYTTRALTNGRLLSEVLLPLPTVEEQIAIALALSDIDEELAALEQLLVKTRALKLGMMQELIFGKTRLFSQGSSHA